MLINSRKNDLKIRSEIKQNKNMASCNMGDRVELSGHREKPLDITLDIDGKKIRKTITGYRSDRNLILNIKHTNDAHGTMPFMANLIRPEEFWVDAGDAWQDFTFSSVLSGGRKEADMMNLRDCDIAIPGNHFYDDRGTEGAGQLIERSRFPYISANTKGMTPSVMAEVEGIKIAFIGIRTTEKDLMSVNPGLVKDLQITDPVESLRKAVEEAKTKGADNIIVLSHLGLEPSKEHPDIVSDKDIAAKVPGIDLIIGGHTHTPTVDKVEVNGTRIVQAGIESHGNYQEDKVYVGEVSLNIDKSSKKIEAIEHRLISAEREASLDDDIKEINDKYLMEEQRVLCEKLGVAAGEFTHDFKVTEDSTLGNFLADVMRKHTGADVSVVESNMFSNRGKNKGPFVIPQGEVDMKDVTEISPWMKLLDTNIETWTVKGKDIKNLLEDGVRKLLDVRSDVGLFQISGMKMVYNPELPEGERVTEIIIGNEPYNPEKTYSFTSTFNVGNWNKVFAGRDNNTIKDGERLRLVVADSIRKEKTIEPVKDGRIKRK